MENLTISLKNCSKFISLEETMAFAQMSSRHLDTLNNGSGAGSDFLGWLSLPEDIQSQLDKIEKTAKHLRSVSDTTVVIGIGGSYLGARAVIEALSHNFNHLQKAKHHEILYAGQNIDEDYLTDLINVLENRNYSIIVISKSGTTTEPAIAFRILKDHLEHKLGKAVAAERIIAITDEKKGALRVMAETNGYETFVIPDNVGGRFSVLTPVGLLPIAVAGFDISKIVKGAKAMEDLTRKSKNASANPSLQYAAARNLLLQNGKSIEILVSFTSRLHYFSEWWKQLYGESEGKDRKGIFPASVGFTTDLHSMGQYIQDGLRVIFETVLRIAQPRQDLILPADQEDLDGLNFLAGRGFDEVNRTAAQGTLLAHVDGGVPNLQIELTRLDEYHLGALLYFYEMGCAISGYMLEVNPFDQPGVEDYKRNMFALLGKPGFEALAATLRQRLG